MSSSAAVARRIVTPGIDRLLGPDRELIAGKRVGLVCNPASVDAELRHSADRLIEAPEVTLADIYRSVLPFVGIMLLTLLIIALFPGIATWLPNHVYSK